jgi:hypothetical protein
MPWRTAPTRGALWISSFPVQEVQTNENVINE